MRALVVGHVTLDQFGTARLPGGGAYYAARTLAALGAEVRVVTGAGPDFPPAALEGLQAHVVPAPRTTRFASAQRGEARVQRADSPAPPLDPAVLPAGWDEADLLVLTPVIGEIDLRRWRGAVKARFAGVQVQGFVRAIAEGGDVSAARWSPAQDELAGVGAAVLGDDDVAEDDDLAERLAAWVPAVAFTHADEGCDVLAGPVRARVGVFRTFAEDPTGAGDCFAAAFFLALARGDDPVSAARLGAAAGSIAVEGRAGTTLARMREAPARAGGITVYQR